MYHSDDYWGDTGITWIRHHVVYRREPYHPSTDAVGGRKVQSMGGGGGERVTYKEFDDGKHYHTSEGAHLLTPRLHLGRGAPSSTSSELSPGLWQRSYGPKPATAPGSYALEPYARRAGYTQHDTLAILQTDQEACIHALAREFPT